MDSGAQLRVLHGTVTVLTEPSGIAAGLGAEPPGSGAAAAAQAGGRWPGSGCGSGDRKGNTFGIL